MKSNRLLPWVGWNTSQQSFVLVERDNSGRQMHERPFRNHDSFVEVTTLWWERFAAAENWTAAADLGKVCTQKRPDLAYGWENWAWALHKLGRSAEAYGVLAPILKKLKLPGPPSGRAAYCLACFCGAVDRVKEGTRWLKLAHALAKDKDAFRMHALHEPDLRTIWPGVPELSAEAVSVLE